MLSKVVISTAELLLVVAIVFPINKLEIDQANQPHSATVSDSLLSKKASGLVMIQSLQEIPLQVRR